MFNNVGNKIKGIAETFCWIGIVGSLITGACLVGQGIESYSYEYMITMGIVVMVAGSLVSWIGSLITYGIGEMVQNSCVLTELAVEQAIKKEKSE